MTRTIHYATDTLTRCGLSLPFTVKVGRRRMETGPVNGNRVRHGHPKSSPLVAHVTCKNCLRSMSKE